MRVTVKTEGWTVDRIVWEVLQDHAPELVQETLRLNPGLAGIGLIVPTGSVLTLPDPPASTPSRTVVRLWD